MIRVTECLEELDIDIKYSGKNVSQNDINIDCPWCGADKHLAIHSSLGLLNCWVCNLDGMERYPSFIDLIRELESITYKDARNIVQQFSDDEIEGEKESWARVEKVVMPESTQNFGMPKDEKERNRAYTYLKRRGFTKAHIKKYELSFTTDGDFHHRIIIPIYYRGAIVNWIGRDYTNNSPDRHKNCPAPDAPIRIKELLYGIDSFNGKHLQLVEGAFDKMRMGDTALAVCRSKISKEQQLFILNLNIDRLTLFFDPDAYRRALDIAENFAPFVRYIKAIKMEDKDVAEHTCYQLAKLETKAKLLTF